MKIATWNVNSIIARLPHVVRWLEAYQPNVLCMQETKCTDDKFPIAELTRIGYCASIFGQQSYNGVAILAREECAEVQRGNYEDQEGAHARLLAATINGVRVINVYIPNGQAVGSEKFEFKLDWMRRLRAFLDSNYEVGAPSFCAATSTWRPRIATFITPCSGANESCAARLNAPRSISSSAGVLQIPFVNITKRADNFPGGITGPEHFAAIWACESITCGFRNRWWAAARIPGSTSSRARGNDLQITHPSSLNSTNCYCRKTFGDGSD